MEKLHRDRIVTLVVGAGKAGSLVVEDILSNKDSRIDIVGFVDDNPDLRGKQVADRPVLGGLNELTDIISKYEVEDLIIAIPSGRGESIRNIINLTIGHKLSYKILPRTSEVLHQDFGDNYTKHIRKVRPEDLLGGHIVKEEQKGLEAAFKSKVVLITGAAGSIGSELSRQIALYGPDKVIFLDWWENGMFDLRNQILELNPDGDYEFIIGDIKDRKKLDAVFAKYKPSSVFHAAAYKHVPLMEHNPSEAVKNNVQGTKTIAELSVRHGVEKFVLVSTDKAVNPTNVMGATKRAAEKIVHILSKAQSKTVFCSVRFGNVVNSNGSAIPTFLGQINRGGPVTVTHKDITRFFMTIPEAVHLILRAWTIGENNDLFVLDMGESIKIYDLAKTLIALEGYVPEEEIGIKITGLRPGEKLYEEVLMDQEGLDATTIDKVFKTKNHMSFDAAMFQVHMHEMLDRMDDESDVSHYVKDVLQKMISTYKPAKH